MPDIGATLRDARMRERIDISEIEAQTKIRAKYLRALENEEWSLLPGPTYVKTFLRTYAEALGLDGKLLVEEYKLNHERLSELELQPIMPGGVRERERGRGRRGRPALPRGWAAMLVVIAVLAVVVVLGLTGGSTSPRKPNRVVPVTGTTSTGSNTTTTPPAVVTPQRASLQLIPTGIVYVCMVGAKGNKILNGVTLQPGTTLPVYHGRKFVVTLGNGMVKMRVNGVLRNVPDVSAPITYLVTPRGRRVLPPAQAPNCA
jgi:hypothetical protein